MGRDGGSGGAGGPKRPPPQGGGLARALEPGACHERIISWCIKGICQFLEGLLANVEGIHQQEDSTAPIEMIAELVFMTHFRTVTMVMMEQYALRTYEAHM